MIEKCANTIADWLINCEVVKETDKQLCCVQYSFVAISVVASHRIWDWYGMCRAKRHDNHAICNNPEVQRRIPYKTRMVVSDMVMPAISIVHGIVISHQMWMGTCIDYCRSSCKPDLFQSD